MLAKLKIFAFFIIFAIDFIKSYQHFFSVKKRPFFLSLDSKIDYLSFFY